MRFILFFLNLLLLQQINNAQDSTVAGKSIQENLINDTGILAKDFVSFYGEPINFSIAEWLYTAGVVGGTFLLIGIDEEIKNKIGRNTIQTLNGDFWDVPTSYGITPYATIFSLSTYAAGLISGSDDIRTTGRLLCESLIISGTGIIVMRYLAGRVRPYYEKGPWEFRSFQTSNEFQSFPSGHTSVAFAISTVLAERIDNIWARVGFYSMATLTAYARVLNNQHFLSDVVWGALLGFGAGIYVVNSEEERENPKDGKSKFSILPYVNGISILYKLN